MEMNEAALIQSRPWPCRWPGGNPASGHVKAFSVLDPRAPGDAYVQGEGCADMR
jgi:hypothetical protein